MGLAALVFASSMPAEEKVKTSWSVDLTPYGLRKQASVWESHPIFSRVAPAASSSRIALALGHQAASTAAGTREGGGRVPWEVELFLGRA